jgi:hypothetical protein
MVTSGQASKHRTGLQQISWFSKHGMIQLDHRITPQHNRLRLVSRDRLGLGEREGCHLFYRRTVGYQLFLERWVHDLEGDTQQSK